MSRAPMDSAERSNFRRGIAVGTLLGFALQIGGYLLTRGDRSEFGWAMFAAVPFISGFAVAAIVRHPRRTAACYLASGILTLSILLFLGWEGIICCVMSLPLAVAGTVVGGFIGYHVRGKYIDRLAAPGKAMAILLLLCPFFMSAAERFERPYRSIEQDETFTTETWVAATPEKTWDLVARMDHLDGDQPFLLRAGLPVPTRCELDQEAVGGKRVCYFDSGLIAQEITRWDRPGVMGLRVTGSTLPGRHWLKFKDASYELHAEGDGTRIIRHTTIGTRLYPRFYWRPLERWGVTSEHEFVFSNLRRWTGTP